MSSAAAPATTAAGDPPVPAKGKKKLILMIVAALLLLVVVGGAGAVHAAAEKEAHVGPPIYVPLEPFVVNLADKDSDRYAQIGLTLEVEDAKFAEQMKLYMPAIRNAILMILAHKQSSELLQRAGKEALAEEIMREAVRPMGIEIAPEPADDAASDARTRAPAVHNPVRRVDFSSFIIQ